MNVEKTELGGLNCHVVDTLEPGASPALAVVLCHGFGAPGTDLVGLGPEFLHREPQMAQSTRFYFPEAPLSLDELGMYGGRAWWPLNIERMAAAVEQGETRDLRHEIPDGLDLARERLLALIKDVTETTGLSAQQIALGGFSQGSMLATDVCLRLPQPVAGLCILSGTLLCEDQWRELAHQQSSVPVLQSHGRQDPLLPFEAAESLRDLLNDSGLPVEFMRFEGMHTIPAEVIDRMGAFLAELASLGTRCRNPSS